MQLQRWRCMIGGYLPVGGASFCLLLLAWTKE